MKDKGENTMENERTVTVVLTDKDVNDIISGHEIRIEDLRMNVIVRMERKQ